MHTSSLLPLPSSQVARGSTIMSPHTSATQVALLKWPGVTFLSS